MPGSDRVKKRNGLTSYGSVLRFYANALKARPSKSLVWYFLKDTKIYLRVLYLSRRINTCITFGSWEEALFFRDTEGRLLGENTAVPNHPSIVWKEKTFSDRRAQTKINEPALKSIASSWEQLLADVARLRAAYMHRFKINSPLNYADLFYLARIGTSMPSFLVRRNKNAISPFQVPVRWARLFKVLAGVHGIVVTMIAQCALGSPELTLVPISREIFDFGDEQDSFVTPTGKACAGSKAMILQLLDAMIHGRPVETISEANEFADVSDQALDYGVYNAQIDLLLLWRAVIHHSIRDEGGLEPASGTLSYEGISRKLQSVCEALKTLVCYCKPERRLNVESVAFLGFNGAGDATRHELGMEHAPEHPEVFEHFLKQVSLCLDKNKEQKITRDELDQRHCAYFTDQVLARIIQAGR